MIHRLCIVGVGLIGGSLALALRQAGYVNEIVGTSRNQAHLRRAVELGVIDRLDLNVARAAAAADVVVLCVPLGAMEPVCQQLKETFASDSILTDVGSAKASVVAAVRSAFGELPSGFVPGHPIAGTEKSGVDAAFAALFQNRRTVLTPLESTSEQACRTVVDMWEATGSIVEIATVDHHDQVLAATSHLPHMLAFGLVDSLARLGDHNEIFRYAAGGFRDFTRIASSDPVMWRDICLANRRALLSIMARFQADLDILAEAIDKEDGDLLLEIFTRAKLARDTYVVG
jgi:prephenate dehydrogenase